MNPPRRPQPYPSMIVRSPTPRPAGTSAAPTSTEADIDLVRRMQAKDERALGAFYDRWYPIVHALAMRMLQSADDVEDVIEETFWQVWRQADRFTADRGSVQTWLLTIARSRALDRLRATKRLREDSMDEVADGGKAAAVQAEAAAGSSDGDFTFAHSESDPLLNAEHAERKRMVVAAMYELPAEQREALELAYFGGLTQSEIAEQTNQPLGTVKTRMRLAMQKLRDRLSLLRDDT